MLTKMTHDDGFHILDRMARGCDLLIQPVLLGVSFSRRYVVHLAVRSSQHTSKSSGRKCQGQRPYSTPVLLHIIVAAGFKEQEARCRMLDENTVHDHFDPLVLWVRVAGASAYNSHSLDSGHNSEGPGQSHLYHSGGRIGGSWHRW